MRQLKLRDWAALSVWTIAACILMPQFCVAQTMSRHGTASSGWLTNFESAKARSKASGVPLLIHFYADWCGPCQTMEHSVLQTAEVRRVISSGIVAVKVNSDLRRDLVRKFGIATLPSDVIVDSNGRVLSKSAGSPGRSGYVARVNRFREEATTDATTAVAAKPVFNKSAVPSPASAATNKPAVASSDSPVASEQTHRRPSDSAVSTQQAEQSDVVKVDTKRSLLTKVLRRESQKRIGLNGYSPVALLDSSEWKAGTKTHKHQFQGVCYLLGSRAELQRFQAEPNRFIPVLHGYDPVSFKRDRELVTGAIELGVRYRDRVYFFASKANRDQFLDAPSRFAQSTELSFSMSSTASETEAEL